MATTPTTRGTFLARRVRVDVDTATYPASAYVQFPAIFDIKPVIEPRSVDDEINDDSGAPREAVTGAAWRLEIKFRNSRNAAGTAQDTVHKFLRTMFNASSLNSNVTLGEFGVRWYDRNGVDDGESYEGRVYVKSWSVDTSGSGDTESVSIVLQGQGVLASITNPAATLTPTISSVVPNNGLAAGGGLIQIFGSRFTGVTGAAGVKFGGTNATSYVVNSDSLITAQLPAHTAGLVDVVVTNGTGPNTNTTVDDFTYA